MARFIPGNMGNMVQLDRDQLVDSGVNQQLEVNNGRGVLYRLPKKDGMAGQSLKTDGKGNLYWG